MTLALIANRGLHKRPGGWSPKELGTLSLWLDADDATTITISTGVSQWDDKSGNGHNFSQATGASQPSWVKGEQNGRAVLTFDGTNHFLTGPDALDLLTGGISVVAAYRNSGNTYLVTKTQGSVNVTGEWAMFGNQSVIFLGATTVTTSAGSSTRKIQAWVVDRSASSTAWVNGTQTDSDTGAPFPNTDSLNTATVMNLGTTNGSTTSRFSGDLYEIVASLTTLSTGDRQKAEGYLAHKWGLTASLPSDHPYKSVAP